MTVRGFSHVAVGVRDLDAVLPFYVEALGFAVRRDVTEHWEERQHRPAMTRRAVYLEYADHRVRPHAAFLVLDQQVGRGAIGGARGLGEVGVNHFGVWVRDVDEVVERARRLGFEPTGPAQVLETARSMGEEAGSFHRGVAFLDPEGNLVQVDQRLPASDGR